MPIAPREVLSIVCVTMLGIWVVLTILNQFNFRWFRLVRGIDLMLLIPRWTFFAPNPGVTDFHLSYRTVAADGTGSDWEEIDFISSRTPWSAIWNPQKRVTKAVVEVGGVLMRLCRDHPEIVPTSPPYLCVLNHAMCAARNSGRGHQFCEFRLAETTRSCDASPDRFFFQSGLIQLGRES